MSRGDLREEARLALHVNDTPRAAEAADRLLDAKSGQPSPADWLIATDVATRTQNPEDAREFSDKVLADARSTRREQLQATVAQANLARLGATNLDSAKVDERLRAIAIGAGDVALDALVVLAQEALAATGGTGSVPSQTSIPESGVQETRANPPGDNVLREKIGDETALVPPVSPLDDIARAIEKHPRAKTTHKLLATDLDIAARDQRDAIIQRTVERWKNADNESLLALAAWLYRNGEFQRLVDAIPLERALQTRELFLQHVDALAALGRWNDIRKIIETERFPLDPVIEHMYLARCFAQQSQQNGAENNWQRALESAAGDPNKLLILGDYAEKNGALPIAAKAFGAAAAASPKSRMAQQGRLRAAYEMRDTRAVYAILLELQKIWPNDRAIKNDEAYVHLLQFPMNEPANPELDKIEALAQQLVKDEPASLPHRTLLALARLKQARGDAALAVYSGIKVPANAVSPSAIAVHAAVLSATGHREEARAEIGRVPMDKLMPEEQVGIANLR